MMTSSNQQDEASASSRDPSSSVPNRSPGSFFSREDPTFLALVLIAGLFAHYAPHGIDYFPSSEMCMVSGYALLAAAIATFVLRPGSRFARIALLLACVLSTRTFWSVCLYFGILPEQSAWLANSGPNVSLLLLKAFLFVARLTGINDRVAEPMYQLFVTGLTFHICTQAFARATVCQTAGRYLTACVAGVLHSRGRKDHVQRHCPERRTPHIFRAIRVSAV